jgi:hypothetical protein
MSRTYLPTVVVLASVLLVVGCGSTPAAPGSAGAAAPTSTSGPTLATSVSSASGPSWAVVKMGGSAATFDDFWELFVRSAGAPNWQLATPSGVASNGGLVVTATGPTSLVAGFRPSQDLTFSPLAATADGGAQWSQNALLTPGLADTPGALAGGAGGSLIALTDTGRIEASTNQGATWGTLTTQRSLTDSAGGRSCGLQRLTAAAWTPTGTPLVGVSCARAGLAGIFASSADGWRLTGPALPGSLSRAAVDVLGLATAGDRTTAILSATTAAGTSVLAAWSADGGAGWQVSPVLAVPHASSPSVSIWADGSAGLRLSAADPRSGAVIGWQAKSWRTLPPLPAKTETLAMGPSGQIQALAADGATMTVWQLATGTGRWALAQTVRVSIPYGSSG